MTVFLVCLIKPHNVKGYVVANRCVKLMLCLKLYLCCVNDIKKEKKNVCKMYRFQSLHWIEIIFHSAFLKILWVEVIEQFCVLKHLLRLVWQCWRQPLFHFVLWLEGNASYLPFHCTWERCSLFPNYIFLLPHREEKILSNTCMLGRCRFYTVVHPSSRSFSVKL